jgi:hypothetical protein
MRKFICRFGLAVIALPCVFLGDLNAWCRDWDNGTFGGS